MNKIKQEQIKTVQIYREFFTKAQAEIKKQLSLLKSSAYCNNCHQCCEIRYSEFSPDELKELGYENFLADFTLVSETNELEVNHAKAKEINEKYTEKVLANSSKNSWFYTCKHYKNGKCQRGKEKPLYCTSYPQTAYSILHENCGFKKWQEEALKKLKYEISKDILQKIQNISDYKNTFTCSCCATCCRLACSEFSYEELKAKAQNGDKFATQFTSVFIPYENEEDAYRAYGEYIDYLRETLPKGEKTYFYYCPKNKNNLCTDYENRPEICREFPTNPLMILPKTCGYKAWRDETHTATLLLHALVEIVDFYIRKIEKNLS